jgi:hypothetical protein
VLAVDKISASDTKLNWVLPVMLFVVQADKHTNATNKAVA